MTIKRYISKKDNTIANALRENLTGRSTKANMGASDILELFSIYGQASSSSIEHTRLLLEFPVSSISLDRTNNIVPSSGSVNFKLKLSNAEHGQTTPENFQISVHPILRTWTEGDGLDMESYLDLEACNWLSSSEGVLWHNTGSDFASSTIINTSSIPLEYTQTLENGVEDIDIDITGLAEEWIKYYESNATAASGSINFLVNPTQGNINASGSITISGDPSNDQTFTLSDASGSQVFIVITDENDFDGTTNDGSGRTPIGIQAVLGNNPNIATRFATAINGQPNVAITAVASSNVVNLIQDVGGARGNTAIDISGLSNATKQDFIKGHDEQKISIYSHEGENYVYTFITSSTISVGNAVSIQVSGTSAATAGALQERVKSDFAGKITTGLNGSILSLTQSVQGLHGNTFISSSIPAVTASIDSFSGGSGMPNYGIVFKFQDAYEDGTNERSYYTKKFYSRTSHEFFKRPLIEAQWDDSIKDDRNYIAKSSSLSPAAENLNNIYLYNRRRGSLVDIPATGSNFVVKLFSSLGSSPETLPVGGGVVLGGQTFITASRESLGVYKAQFAYTGSETFLYDVWHSSSAYEIGEIFTGSGFTVYTESNPAYYEIPDYNVNITNLKDSYLPTEKTTFRVYTRNKNWNPNVYTKATQQAPVNNIKELFYKIVKVSDNYEVISYSTGSTPSYSSLSYDNQGSFFDLDMSLLESNNAYEVSFVFKDGPNYLEQKEKFRFRVDP